MKTWIPSGLCQIGFNKLWDHTRPSGPKIKSRGWNLSTKGVLNLIEGEEGIEGEIFFEFDAIIPIKSPAKGNLGQEMILELELAISRDPMVEFAHIWSASRANSNVVVDRISKCLDG